LQQSAFATFRKNPSISEYQGLVTLPNLNSNVTIQKLCKTLTFLNINVAINLAKPCIFQSSSLSERSLFYPNVRYSCLFWNVTTGAGPFGAFYSSFWERSIRFVLEVCPLVASVLRSTLVASRRVSRQLCSGVLLKNEWKVQMSEKPIS